MRMAFQVTLPIEPFNTYVKNGSAEAKIQQALGEMKPEAVYFTEQDGHRGAFIVVNVNDASEIPAKAEPLFVLFNAEVRMRIVMTPEDLGKAGLGEIGKRLQ